MSPLRRARLRPRLIRGDAGFDWLLGIAALTHATVRMFGAPGVGDYPTDAGPALTAIAHRDLSGFLAHQPAMGGVSLYLRAPFVAIGAALGDGPIGLYRWGAWPCVLSVVILALWLSRLARNRGTGRLGQVLIVAVCTLNPLVTDALYWGHPEELLTASLAVGTLLAATERRVLLAVLLGGLAIASKQWALLIVAPAVLGWERGRVRGVLGMGAVALVATLPLVIGDFGAFRHALTYISRPQPVMTFSTWLYPFSPTGVIREANIFGPVRMFRAREVWGFESLLSHPLIILLGVALPVLVWWRRGRRLAAQDVLLVSALAFLLRCALDPGSVGYYHLPFLLLLVALDAWRGGPVPVYGLAAALAAFVVLDRFPAYLGWPVGNAVYILASAVALALLVRELRRARSPRCGASSRLTSAVAVGAAEARLGAPA